MSDVERYDCCPIGMTLREDENGVPIVEHGEPLCEKFNAFVEKVLSGPNPPTFENPH